MTVSRIAAGARSWANGLRRPWVRRTYYAGLLLVVAILCLFPRPYVARVKLLPQDSGTGAAAMIAALGGGVQNFAAVLGSQKTNYLVIGRSHDVQRDVIARLKLIGRKGFRNLDQAETRLSGKVDIEILTGGILEITARDSDADFAEQLVSGYMSSIQERLAALGHEQTAHKKEIVVSRLRGARFQLEDAEAKMNQFRLAHNLADPETEFSAAINRKLSLQSQLQMKELEIKTAKEFATGENIRIKTLTAEIGALRNALAATSADDGVNRLSSLSVEYLQLYRDVKFNESLVEIYRRFFEEVGIEELSAGHNTQIIEKPYIDPRRKFNMPAVGMLFALILLVFYTEYYMPMTGLSRARVTDV